ncbi:hypothetical protein GC163_17980 [bacterium]|nr:hypothetical protein [bacterium]
MSKATRESLLAALRKLVRKCGPDVTLFDFREATGIPYHYVYDRWGSWTRLRQAAGLSPRKTLAKVYTDDELLQAYHDVAVRVDAYPGIVQFNRLSPHCWNTLAARFGKHTEVQRAYLDWLARLPDMAKPSFLQACPPGCEPTNVPGVYVVRHG